MIELSAGVAAFEGAVVVVSEVDDCFKMPSGNLAACLLLDSWGLDCCSLSR